MLERDWQADFEVSEAFRRYFSDHVLDGLFGEWDDKDRLHAVLRKRGWELLHIVREALPYWLQRVRELEDALTVMFGTTDVKKARSDLGGILCRLEEAEKYADELERKLERLEAENARLRAVAEAAKQVYLYHNDMRCSTWQNLWVTLAALEEENKSG